MFGKNKGEAKFERCAHRDVAYEEYEGHIVGAELQCAGITDGVAGTSSKVEVNIYGAKALHKRWFYHKVFNTMVKDWAFYRKEQIGAKKHLTAVAGEIACKNCPYADLKTTLDVAKFKREAAKLDAEAARFDVNRLEALREFEALTKKLGTNLDNEIDS